MKQEYKEAFSEVNEILKLMPQSLLNKIPISFRNMINNEKADDYKLNISESFEKQELKDNTLIILGLIYRDFLCDNKEREILKANDSKKLKEVEDELREKYNPDNIFKNNKIQNTVMSDNQENVALIKYEEEKWYKRIWTKIKNLFKNKT